jgi:hypothetical protein
MQVFPLERGRNLICQGVLADDSNVLPVVSPRRVLSGSSSDMMKPHEPRFRRV